MFLKLVRNIAKPHTFAIIDRIKRSSGLSVSELAEALEMSYMGVKQHCVELERKGLLDTWRSPGATGRPRKLYRLTARAAAFYPERGNELALELLNSIRRLYGPMGVERLLFNWSSERTGRYLKKVRGATPAERAASLTRLRDAEGHCAMLERDETDGTLRVVEFHDPFQQVAEAYPAIHRFETQMFQRLLQTPVERREERSGALVKMIFHLPEVIAEEAPPPAKEEAEPARDGAEADLNGSLPPAQ